MSLFRVTCMLIVFTVIWAGILLMLALAGCVSRCQAGATICGGPYLDVPWLP